MAKRFFTSVKAFEAEAVPTPSVAELGLIAAVRDGTSCKYATTRPTAPTRDNTVREPLLRLLITGATPDCGLQPFGFWLEGAWIDGMLDLRFCTAQGRTVLHNCHFKDEPRLDQAHLKELSVQGSMLGAGLFAQGARIDGDVFLRGVEAVGTIDLNGATIGGQLACVGASLSGPRDAEGAVTGHALDAEGAKIDGDVFLSGVKAVGTIDLTGATIDAQLACAGASLSGPRDAKGAVTGHALNAQSVSIGEGLFFREVTSVIGDIDLAAGQCRVLADDAESWARCDGNLYLDGFTYDRIGPASPTTLAARRVWLRRGATMWGSIYPQPYTQFAKVLRETGHGAEARRVRIAAVEHRVELQVEEVKALRRFIRSLRGVVKAPNTQTREAMQSCAADLSADAAVEAKRRMDRTGAALRGLAETDDQERAFAVRGLSNDLSRRAIGLQVWRIWLVLRDRNLRWTIGYGFAPARSLWTLAGLIGTAWLLAHLAWEEGSFAPGSGPILLSEGWASVQAAANPAAVWSADTALGGDWESFSAPAYAFDVVVPLIDIGQTQAWAPSTERGFWGRVLWAARWVLTILGWVVTALGAAAVTGIVQRGQPE